MNDKEIGEEKNKDFTKLIEIIRSYKQRKQSDLQLTLNLINEPGKREYLSSELLKVKNELTICHFEYRSNVLDEITNFVSI